MYNLSPLVSQDFFFKWCDAIRGSFQKKKRQIGFTVFARKIPGGMWRIQIIKKLIGFSSLWERRRRKWKFRRGRFKWFITCIGNLIQLMISLQFLKNDKNNSLLFILFKVLQMLLCMIRGNKEGKKSFGGGKNVDNFCLLTAKQ